MHRHRAQEEKQAAVEPYVGSGFLPATVKKSSDVQTDRPCLVGIATILRGPCRGPREAGGRIRRRAEAGRRRAPSSRRRKRV